MIHWHVKVMQREQSTQIITVRNKIILIFHDRFARNTAKAGEKILNGVKLS